MSKPMIKPSHRGKLHKALGVPAGHKIPAGMLRHALESKNPKTRKQAQFAVNAAKWKH